MVNHNYHHSSENHASKRSAFMKCPECRTEMENKRNATSQVLWHTYKCPKCGYEEQG